MVHVLRAPPLLLLLFFSKDLIADKAANCCYQGYPIGCNKYSNSITYGNSITECMQQSQVAVNISTVVIVGDGCPYGNMSQSVMFERLSFVSPDQKTLKLDLEKVEYFVRSLSFQNITVTSASPTGISTIAIISDRDNRTTLSFEGSRVESGVTFQKGNNIWWTIVARKSRFHQQGNAPTMFDYQTANGGGLDFSGPENVIKCTNCANPVIKGGLCGTSTIEGVSLEIEGEQSSSAVLIDLIRCPDIRRRTNFNLSIWENVFLGAVQNTGDAGWLQVDTTPVYPIIYLRNNDYSQLDEATQKGRIYRIYEWIANEEQTSEYQVVREFDKKVPPGWKDESPLATGICKERVGKSRVVDVIEVAYVPIGRTAMSSQSGPCPRCCSVVTDEGTQYGTTIAACLAFAQKENGPGEKVVNVLSYCRAGKYDSPLSTVKIAMKFPISTEDLKMAPNQVGLYPNNDRTAADRVAIIFDQGNFSFVPEREVDVITFENIHFKKRDRLRKLLDGISTIKLGRANATGYDASFKMVGCYVDKDVVVRLGHDAHYTAVNTTFSPGKRAETSRNHLKRTIEREDTPEPALVLDPDVNQVVELSNCLLSDDSCEGLQECTSDSVCKTVMRGTLGSAITIKNTELRKTVSSCASPAIDITVGGSHATLKIEGTTFNGEVANTEEAAWIKVQGRPGNDAEVFLLNNDYSGLNGKELTQKGRVYRFHQVSVTRRVTLSSLQTLWDANTALATNVCSPKNAPVLPIGRGLIVSHKLHQECSRLCCALKTPDEEVYESGVPFQGSSISECLLNLMANAAQTLVEVFAQCPLGHTMPRGRAEVVKSDTYAGDSELAVITGRSRKKFRLARSNGIAFKNIRFKVVNVSAPPNIANSPIEFGTDCACIEELSEACYSSLWEAFDRVNRDRSRMSTKTTIRIKGICNFGSDKAYRQLRGKVRILKKRSTRGPAVVFFSSAVMLVVTKSLYVGPAVELQTHKQFGSDPDGKHVRIFVGRRSQKATWKSALQLYRATVQGYITIVVEEAGRLKANQTMFSGRPRIRTSDAANGVTDSIQNNSSPVIHLAQSNFTREFERKNAKESLIGVGCAIGTRLKIVQCSFPDTKVGSAVEYCYCAGGLNIQYSNFGMLKDDVSKLVHGLVHVTACDKQKALEHRRGKVVLDGVSFTDASNAVTSPGVGAIRLHLHQAGPDVLVRDINYGGFQGREMLAEVASAAIFIVMYSGYNGTLKNIVENNYIDMSYAREKDFGGSLACVLASNRGSTETPIFPIVTKEAFLNKVVYRCDANGTVFANDVAVPVHEENLDKDDPHQQARQLYMDDTVEQVEEDLEDRG